MPRRVDDLRSEVPQRAEESPIAYRARWVLPIAARPLEDGIVTVAAGRIVEVGTTTSASEIIDLGQGILLPALVNAHTHLELSHNAQPLGNRRQGFPDWIAEVVSQRRQKMEQSSAAELLEQRRTAVAQGLAESAAAGVVLVGDIASANYPAEAYAADQVSGVVFEELIGLGEERIEALLQLAVAHLDRTETGPQRDEAKATWRVGLSPHAPYTVHPELLRRVCELSATRQCPIAMHLAESPAELELMATHSGPFLPMLEKFAAWYPAAIKKGSCPQDYLELLATAHRALVIHGNYLTAAELDFLAQQRETMSLVYCPRTHDYFHAAEHPLREALNGGVRVAIGTDSRASNPDLSLWEELRFVRARYPELTDETVLQLGTLAGAEALGMADNYGSLTVGKVAAMVVAESDDRAKGLFEQTLRRL